MTTTAISNITKGSSVALDCEKAKVQGKLADWTTCPSGKTSEGKAIIKNLDDQLSLINSEIGKSSTSKPNSPNNLAANTFLDSSAAQSSTQNQASSYKLFVSSLNLFA